MDKGGGVFVGSVLWGEMVDLLQHVPAFRGVEEDPLLRTGRVLFLVGGVGHCGHVVGGAEKRPFIGTWADRVDGQGKRGGQESCKSM